MPICGTRWQPQRLDRVVEMFPTSTRVAKVSTDAGLAYVKGMGNPAGLGSLISELVCTELAAWLGLRVPDFAIVQVSDLEIPMLGHGSVLPGPAFASRELPARAADGTDTYLRLLREPADIAKLVVFDTWVRNSDRQPPADALDPSPRYENLIFSPVARKYDIIALDHTHCFTDGDLEHDIGDPEITLDERVYGFFPEFRPFLRDRDVRLAVARLSAIDVGFVREVVRSVPVEWGMSALARGRLVDTICARAERVALYVPATLNQQLDLDV